MPALEKFYFKKKGTVAPLVFLPEPVVHSAEWSTGSWLLPCFAPFSRFPAELVVHSTEWSTGSQLLPCFAPFSRFPAELVVHSTEWTTGSQLLPWFEPFSRLSGRASGPLDRVDH